MPTDAENVRSWEQTGSDRPTLKTTLLTRIGRRPADRVTPVVCHFSLAAQSQSARLRALDEGCSHGGHMERRGFISLLGGAAVWPVVASAQQPLKPVIGFLSSASPVGWDSYLAAFRDGLRYHFVHARNPRAVLLPQKSICDNQSHQARENQQCREGFSDHWHRRMARSR
jgi:hypothetical protein